MYDLLLKGGTVLDPSSRLDGAMDVAVEQGAIARIAPQIAETEAARTIDVRGKTVTPGLIDLHAHVFEGFNRTGVNPDLGGVQVDQAGRDRLAPHIDGARGFRLRDLRRDARDRALLHRHVHRPVEPGGGIQHGAALEQEIVHGESPIDQRVKWSQRRPPAATESGTSSSKR